MAGRVLQNHGASVTLFDKARWPGGRANTREHGSYRFDHGAQFFTVRDPGMLGHLESWIEEGVVSEWTGTLLRITEDQTAPAKDSVRYVGVPGMVDLPAALAQGLDVRVATRVREVRPGDSGWSLFAEDESALGIFDTVVVALPAPQAMEFLRHTPRLRDAAEKARMAPCWAGMYAFEEPLALDFDGAFLSGGPLSWVARDSSKPGRPNVETWVVHAGPNWSRENLGLQRTEAALALLKELRALFGPTPDPLFHRAHRWAFALASDPAPKGALFDQERSIGTCGDWCMGGRIEGALLSGLAVANQILHETE
jgi:predicted NAD/FAD-dependent oxidoreductase